jgi:hypothetical protein
MAGWVAGALCAPGLQAAEWVRVSPPDQHEHAYDRDKLSVEGDFVTYWRRVIFRTPEPSKGGLARMALYRERIDCRSHTHRTLGYLLYAQDGGIIENVYTPQAPEEPVIPETLGDRYEQLMCMFVEQGRRAREAANCEAGDPALADALRAEIARLESRIRELEGQLRDTAARSRTQPAQ